MHIDPERAPNKTDPNSVPLPAFLGHQLGEIINGKWRCALREGGRRRHVLMPPRPPQQWKMDLPLPARGISPVEGRVLRGCGTLASLLSPHHLWMK